MGRVSNKEARASSGTSGRVNAHSPTARGREIAGILLLALALFVGLSVGSLQFGAGTLMGPGGAIVGLGGYALVGVGAYLGAIALGAAAVRMLCGREVRFRSVETLAGIIGAMFAAMLLHLATGSYRLRGYSTGGLVGEYGAELMVALLGTAGTVLFGVTGLLLSAVGTTSLTMVGIGRGVAGAARTAWATLTRASLAAFPSRAAAGSEAGGAPVSSPAQIVETRQLAARRAEAAKVPSDEPTAPGGDGVPEPRKGRKRKVENTALQQPAANAPAAPPPAINEKPALADAQSAVAATQQATTEAPAAVADEADRTEVTAGVEEPKSDARGEPAIIAPLPRPQPPAAHPSPLDYIRLGDGDYRLPELSLLDFDDPGHGDLDRQAMLDLASRLEKTLADYGVKGRVSEIHPGPVVTMYEFVPQAGTKLSKITALSNDLAMALEALKVRIVAPIPGKAAVGIEVPNKVRETVFLKEIIGSDPFAKAAAKSKLTMALGKDIVGNPTVVDLAKMPHLLVAGTTGSGKSVSVNGMICSLLFNASPEEVKLIMIDPKMLELSIYEGIPHLLLPVVTDPKKANLALRWAVEEMERRYDLISKSGVRDIASYNKKVAKLLGDEGAAKPEPTTVARMKKMKVMVAGADGAEQEAEIDAGAELAAGGHDLFSVAHRMPDAAMQQELRSAEPPKKLPFIVIIIDEFADLMMVASKEVEHSVARIAQKARAAGIHLLLATQRPSVDVITGLIKANFPSRIAFQVASKIDARTILDQQGAESLLGMGDMLFTDRGLALKRVHGPLITDVEIHRVVEFLKGQGKPVYDLDILKPRADEDGEGGEDEEHADEMYDQAVAIVGETRQASTSMLQRRLRVGYNRAARMIERMEREGIVGPADGAKPREVLVSAHAA